MRCLLKNNKSVTLLYHTLEEWAEEQYKRCIALGCSEKYARKVKRSYREAEVK